MDQGYTIVNQIMEIDNNYIDSKVMKRIRKYLIASWFKYVIATGITFELLLALYCFLYYPIFYSGLFVLLSLLLGLLYPFLLNQTVKKCFLQRGKVNKNSSFKFKLIFDEEKIVYVNNEHILLKYNQLEKIVETENEYIIITKFGKYILCQKKNMTRRDIQQLIELSKKHAIKL